MAFTFLRFSAITGLDRHSVTSRAREALESCGSILDFHIFSNRSICLKFELQVGKLAKLHDSLQEAGLKLSEESERLFANCRSGLKRLGLKARASEVTGTLEITFVHDEPDLRIEVPPVPG